MGRSDIRESIRPDDIRPEHVLQAIDLVRSRTEPGAIPSLEDSPVYDDVDIYFSDFAPDGCLEWYPVVRRPMQEIDFVRMTYRAMWLEFLRERASEAEEAEALARMLACFDGSNREAIESWQRQMTEAMEKLLTESSSGIQISGALLTVLRQGESMKRAKTLVKDLMELDERIRLLGEVHRIGRPIVAIARFERDNLEGADPVILTRTTRGIYEDIHARAGLMIAKARRIAEQAQRSQTT